MIRLGRTKAGTLPLSPDIRQLHPPLTRKMLAPLEPECEVVQFSSLPGEKDLRRVADLLATRPDVSLRAYGSYDGSITDLEFLRGFPSLRRFQADVYGLESIDGLRHLPDDVDFLALGQTKRRMDLRPVARFGQLQRLFLEGHTKGFEVVGGLSELVDLTLRSITLPDLRPLLPLRRLRVLDIKLGGTRDLGLLPEIGELRYLELWMVRSLADLSAVSRVESLWFLFLQALRNVTSLPDLRRLPALRGVHLETMKGLQDLGPLRSAPALEALSLVDMGQLSVDDVAVLAGHPTLAEVTVGLGSLRRNDLVAQRLGLPRVRVGKNEWRRLAAEGG